MAHNVGGVVPSKIMVGDKPVQRVYVGDRYVWPSGPSATVQWIGSTVASGPYNNGFVPHQPGDLLVMVTTESGPYTAPLPAGFTSAYSNGQGVAIQIAWKIATTSNTDPGYMSAAFYTCAFVFRGASTTKPFGGINSTSASSAGISGPTLQNTSGDALLCYGFCNNGTTGYWGYAPEGYIAKHEDVPRMGILQRIDSTTAPAATWSIGAGNCNHRNWVFEILPESAAADAPATRQAGAIKGNADSGLYHVPGSAHYEETIAEQWFKTEAQAKAAGFVKYTGGEA